MVCFIALTSTLLRHIHLNANYYLPIPPSGPPSQSLGVDPVDPAVMRRPPRKKNAPIITKRLLYRVLFSASIIVIGTLFIYVFALKDKDMSRREQTMVSFFFFFFLSFFLVRFSCAFALFLCFFSFASTCSSCPS
jgi:magnesium-transporting ATPase (P-type)